MNGDHSFAAPQHLAQQSPELAELFSRAKSAYRDGLDEARAWEALQSRLTQSPAAEHAQRAGRRVAWVVFAAAAALAFTWFGWKQYRVRADAAEARAHKPMQPTAALFTNASIRLAPGKSQLPDGTSVELTDDARGTLVADAHRSTLQFDHGRLDIHVAHQVEGHAFAVRTRDVEFVVLGTRFTVVTQETQVDLSVAEGRVLVNNAANAPTIVQAGERWSNHDQPLASPDVSASAAASVTYESRSAPESPNPIKANDIDITACHEYVRNGQLDAAQNCYLSAARGRGLTAEMALYEVARLRRDVLSNPSGSLAALDDYESRFPAGTLAPEVRIARVELLSRLGRYDEALTASAQLLASSVGRARQVELRLLRATLLRDKKHDCAAAIAEYRQIESDRGPRGDQAQFAKAGCLERLGSKTAAIQAYTLYLQRSQPAQADAARRHLEELSQ